jgi:hypothetical protein
MQRGLAHASKSVLAGVAAFVATSAVIVTFAVNQVNPPRQAPVAATPSSPSAPSSAAAPEHAPKADAGVGTQARPSDEPVSTDGDDASGELPGSSEGSPGVGVDLDAATSKLDPALTDLIGRDVPEALEDLLPPVKDLPVRELLK